MSCSPPRRKCRCCNHLFVPDPRTADRQRYCSAPDCRQASTAASQHRWLGQNGNGDYFRGPEAVRRVQAWRASHPGYWKRKQPASAGAQVIVEQTANPAQSSCNVPRELARTLQDDCLTQDPAFVGLISMVTGSTLQADIAATTRQLLLRGRNILGLVSSEITQRQLNPDRDQQISVTTATAAPDSPEL